MTDPQTPPGWYPTPDGRQRYWDGWQWTQHFRGSNPAQVPLPPKQGGALKWVLLGLGLFFVLGLGSCIAFIAAVGSDTSSVIESSPAPLQSSDAPSQSPEAAEDETPTPSAEVTSDNSGDQDNPVVVTEGKAFDMSNDQNLWMALGEVT